MSQLTITKPAWWTAGAIGAALVLAGCGGGPAAPGDADAPADDAVTAAADSGDDSQDSASGTIDCSQIDKEKFAEYAVWLQLLAQLESVGQIEGFTTLGYTPAAFDERLDMLAPVGQLPDTGFGNPKESLDLYRELNAAAAAIIAKGDAATQADFDAYTELSGGTENVIMKQLAINAPLSEACPDL